MGSELGVGGPIVLVAEDDAGMRALYREVLMKRGLQVVETENGLEVVDLARRHVPKMVLLDVRLPGLGGEDVLRALRSDADLCAIPVVAATGLGGSDAEDWKAAGFDDVLFKPIRLSDLIATVQRFLA